MSEPNDSQIPLPFQLSRIISSLWKPQAIHVAAALGIADALADGPRQSDDLARAVGAHPAALRRLMRALVVLELCTQTDDGAFALTPLGACLRSGVRDSVRSWALLWGGEKQHQRMWARTGGCAHKARTRATIRRRCRRIRNTPWLSSSARAGRT